jgi:RNA polymerase sigma factor (sigma-70 family)
MTHARKHGRRRGWPRRHVMAAASRGTGLVWYGACCVYRRLHHGVGYGWNQYLRRPSAAGTAQGSLWPARPADLDADLIMVVDRSDGDGLARLFDAYAGRLLDYAASMLGDAQHAAEVVHDTLIDAARRAPRLRDRRQLNAWLYAAARRRLRHRHLRRQLCWDWTGHLGDTHATRPPAPAGEDLLDVRAVVEGVLGRLDRDDQEILLLSVRHGLNTGTVAAVFGISPRQAARKTDTAHAHAIAAIAAVGKDRTPGSVPDTGRARHSDEPHDPPGQDDGPADAPAVGHQECGCPGRLDIRCLLTAASIPRIPPGLRAWVLHSGSDPQLAGYRADIVARGGALTEHGMPHQPEAVSPLARRAKTSAAKTTVAGTALFTATLTATFAFGTTLLPMLLSPSGRPSSASHHHQPRPTLAANPLARRPPRPGPPGTEPPSSRPQPTRTAASSLGPEASLALPPSGQHPPIGDLTTKLPLPAIPSPHLPPVPIPVVPIPPLPVPPVKVRLPLLPAVTVPPLPRAGRSAGPIGLPTLIRP